MHNVQCTNIKSHVYKNINLKHFCKNTIFQIGPQNVYEEKNNKLTSQMRKRLKQSLSLTIMANKNEASYFDRINMTKNGLEFDPKKNSHRRT